MLGFIKLTTVKGVLFGAQKYARKQDRKIAERIREAMEFYRETKIHGLSDRSFHEHKLMSPGAVSSPLEAGDDMPGELIDL